MSKGTAFTGPLKSRGGPSTNNVGSLELHTGTREAGTDAASFIFTPVANASTTITATVTNASHAQSSTYTQQDIGQVAANNIVASASLVNNNLVSASGTLGNVQDSGISSSSVSSLITQVAGVTTSSFTLNTASVGAAYAAPVQLLAAPGAGKTILIQEGSIYTASTGNTAYATGTSPVIQYDSTVHGAGTAATSALATGDLTAASSQIKSVANPTGALTGITNKGIFFSNATGAYTAGTGTNVTISLTYQIVTATV